MKLTLPRLSRGLIIAVVLIVVLALLPVIGAPKSWLLYIFLFFLYLAMANMWNLLAGYSGLISLCQAAFIGLAGYTLAITTWLGYPFYVGILGGAIVCGIFALLISYPVFRLAGIYFAIGTLVVPEALRMVFFLWRPVGGELHGGGAGYMVKGVTAISMSEIYWFALIIGIGSVILMRMILRSKLGLGLAAIRDNTDTAASSGVDVFRIKLNVFIIGAVVTGLAGAIFYVYQGYIEPISAYNIRWTMTMILATVIGGLRTIEGPIIGTIIAVFLHFLLARYAGISLLVQGVILVMVMLLVPQGIVGYTRETRIYRKLSQLFSWRRGNSP